MKKIIVASGLLLGAMVVITSVNSCGTLKGVGSFQGVSKVADIASTAKEIASVLGSTLV